MNTLKKLGAVIVVMFVLAFAAFADCPQPGTMDTPCSSAQITPDEPAAPVEPSTSSTSNAIEISVTTLDVLLSALSIF